MSAAVVLDREDRLAARFKTLGKGRCPAHGFGHVRNRTCAFCGPSTRSLGPATAGAVASVPAFRSEHFAAGDAATLTNQVTFHLEPFRAFESLPQNFAGSAYRPAAAGSSFIIERVRLTNPAAGLARTETSSRPAHSGPCCAGILPY